MVAVLRITGCAFPLLLCGIAVAGAADPRSAAEVDRMFPLPMHFGPFDRLAARSLAREGAAVLSATLLDYPHARFQNVEATFQADWRSWNRDYYICGEINAPNRMGGYVGWQHFVITENKNRVPTVFYGHSAGGELL